MAEPVVAGLDGSRESLTAVRWGAQEAVARGVALHLLYSSGSRSPDAARAREAADQRRHGDDALRDAQANVHQLHPHLPVTTEQVPEPAVQALVEHSGRAALMVLGSRGRGALAGFLLGSVSLHVLGRAECPVVMVRAEEHGTLGDPQSEIVVGVQDVGPAGEALLEFAFTAADTHHTKLRAVHAWGPPAFVGALPTAPPTLPDEISLFEAGQEQTLAEALAPWQAKFPGVEVIEHVESGAAAPVLLDAAANGDLLVVGRRLGRSPMRLGPVAHAALHHARCPVAVVPHD